MLYTINTDVISYYSPVYKLYYTQLILMLLVTTVLCINYINTDVISYYSPVYKLYYTRCY